MVTRLTDVADRVAALLAGGEPEAARALVESVAARQPAAAELGRAAIALFDNDPEAAIDHARRALDRGAGGAGHQYLALGQLAAGNTAGAIAHARKAVEIEPTMRARSNLASVLLATDHADEAAPILREARAEHPFDADVLLNLGAAAAELGDYGEALVAYAQAFDRRPSDARPLDRLLEMFAAVGKWLGAAAALDLLRPGEAPPEVEVALAMVKVRVVQLIANGFPEREVDGDIDRTVAKLVANALARGPQTQLAVAHTLLEAGRETDGRALVEAADAHSARTPLDGPAAGELRYLQAHLAARDGNAPRSLALYALSLASNPRRIDACTHAIALLLEDGSRTALAQIPQWLERVPAADRPRDPNLALHEAMYLRRIDRAAQARVLAQRALELTGSDGPIAEVAQELLDELGAAT
jgi:hypothetical protein